MQKEAMEGRDRRLQREVGFRTHCFKAKGEATFASSAIVEKDPRSISSENMRT